MNVSSAFRTRGAPHLALIPVPDLERTDHFLVFGANPVVSNGSLMTAPDVRRRLHAIQERGRKIVVIDPRRTTRYQTNPYVNVSLYEPCDGTVVFKRVCERSLFREFAVLKAARRCKLDAP